VLLFSDESVLLHRIHALRARNQILSAARVPPPRKLAQRLEPRAAAIFCVLPFLFASALSFISFSFITFSFFFEKRWTEQLNEL
jgi:hypothetical protein